MSLFARIDRSSVWHVIVLFTFCAIHWHQRATTWGIVLLLIHFLADQHLIQKIKSIRLNLLGIWAIVFFAYHLIGMLWTDYPDDGWKSIEVKLCFLILPILFAGENHLSHRSFRAIMPYFLISGVIAFIYSFLFAMNKYLAQGITVVFNRVNLTEAIMHPGYWSNYFAFGIVFICYALWISPAKNKLQYYVILAVYFAIFLLLNSKTTFIFLGFFAVYLSWKATAFIENRNMRLGGFSVMAVIVLTVLIFLPPVKKRIKETIYESKPPSEYPLFAHSTESRIAAWTLERKLVAINPVIGYGTGSANPLLLQSMKKHRFDDLVKYNMHTHSQFFHTWIDIGLLGLLLMLGFWIYSMVYFVMRKNGMAFWTSLLCFIYIFTDDALEIQAIGVFCVFMIFLLQKLNKPQYR